MNIGVSWSLRRHFDWKFFAGNSEAVVPYRTLLVWLVQLASVHPRCLLCHDNTCMTDWMNNEIFSGNFTRWLETSSLSHFGNFLVSISLLSFVCHVRILLFLKVFSSPVWKNFVGLTIPCSPWLVGWFGGGYKCIVICYFINFPVHLTANSSLITTMYFTRKRF